MSYSKINLRALPNVDFVHGYPGIPAGPERPQATIRGTIEVRLGNQPVKVKWIKIDFRKVETIPGGSNGEEFVDFVGQTPMTVWQAQEEGETLFTKDFPFNIRVPETIPPSVALGRGAGIKYEVVATLCMKGKKGVFRRDASTTISNSVPVVIDKHELHSTWPVYAQPESRQVTSDGLTLVVNRSNTCFAPADHLNVMATLKSDNLSPVVLRGFEFLLRETIIYRAGPQSHNKKHGPQTHMSILGQQRVPVSTTLYGGTQHKVELGCIVPGNHTTSSVNAGRHIDIGYTMNVKAILDTGKPISMDLPVTITNWPRHVSADMMRRIGTAPNLSLVPPGVPEIPTVSQPSDRHPSVGAPLSPRLGGLPNSPHGAGHQAMPPGALISGSSGPPVTGSASNGKHPYASGLQGITGQATHHPLVSGVQQRSHTTPSQSSLVPGSVSGKPSTANSKREAKNDLTISGASATEFGYHRTAVPSRQTQSYDKVIDVSGRTESVGGPRVSITETSGESEVGGPSRNSQHVVDVRPNAANRTMSARRPRTMSRTLQIVNATEDIPEDDSPVKATTSEPLSGSPRVPQEDHQLVSSPVTQTSSSSPWPTAEEEKQRLFNSARARVEKVQAQVRRNAAPAPSAQNDTPSHSNSRNSVEEHVATERPRTVSPRSPESTWPAAEDEKRRLYEQAQANARRTQAMVMSPQSPPANGSAVRLTHNRTASANSSHEFGKRPYMTTSPPTISAGAALYSHAISSMKSAAPHSSQASPSLSRIPAAQVESSNDAMPPTQYPAAGDEKAAIRYREAQQAVGRRLREDVPQEAPIAYDALFPSGDSDATTLRASSERAPYSQPSEKEVLRRALEARDAAMGSNRTPLAHPTQPTVSNGAQSSTQTAPLHPDLPSWETEPLRRAFSARDAPTVRSGQALAVPMRIISRQSSVQENASTLSHTEPRERKPLSEKEQMRLAFENRDRVLATQQAPSPPKYGASLPVSPVPPPSFDAGHMPLTAAQEKAQLKARYAQEEADSDVPANISADVPTSPPTSPRVAFEHASLTEESHKYGSSEVHLHRDPGISAGKKRASQMITPPPPSPPPPPPPLLPRPPPEYIEETKREDMRNNSLRTASLSIDFSAPLDLDLNLSDNKLKAGSSTILP